MHGRVKVRSTAEQEARKRKERQIKIIQYRKTLNSIFEKRDNNVFNDELIMLTERILLEIPDLNTVWNIRREAFKKRESCQEEFTELLKKELTLTENCLQKNPKSYSLWHQRYWIIQHLPTPDWKSELELCEKCLNFDDRNFHCWDYRQQLVKKAGVSNQKEFDFSEIKIMNNLSNYSSWHYRSKILPALFPDQTGKLPICSERCNKELDLVINAVFTDPNDSSAWLYQRWLLDYNAFEPNTLWQIVVIDNHAAIVCHGDTQIKPDELILTRRYVPLDNDMKDFTHQISVWHSYDSKIFSKRWHAILPDISSEIDKKFCSISIEYKNKSYDLHRSEDCNVWFYKSPIECVNKHDTQLTEQMINIQKLLEMEPNNKWALLTLIFLMKNLDLNKYYDDILKNLSILSKIDKIHEMYYTDIRNKYILDYKLHSYLTKENYKRFSMIDLSNIQLTVLYNEHYLSFFDQVNLSGNQLNFSLHRLAALQNCKKLSLCNNNLKNLKNFPYLPNLECLSLRKNELTDIEEILNLLKLHKLIKLDIRSNPIWTNKSKTISKIFNVTPNLILESDK
ncbi:GSCOCG00011660001-RA-CDS [Cotesia congregata]|nr:GSCOCG00011660001-RA-CDS [Cotesia congregata]